MTVRLRKGINFLDRVAKHIVESKPADPLADQPPQVREAVRAYRAVASPMNLYIQTMDGEGLLQGAGLSADATLDELQESYSRELELLSLSIVKRDRFKGLRK